MRKILGVLSLIVIVVILVAVIFLVNSVITGRVVAGKCYESDRGIIYETKGSCWLQYGTEKFNITYDSCVNNSVKECYCDQKGTIKIEIAACSYGCKDGRCIKRQEFLASFNQSKYNITCYPAITCLITKTTLALIKENNISHIIQLINTTVMNFTTTAIIKVDNVTQNVLKNKQYNFTKTIKVYVQDIFHVQETKVLNVSNVSYVKLNMTFSS